MAKGDMELKVVFDDASLDVALDKVRRLAEELEATQKLVADVTQQVQHLEAEEQLVTPSAAVYAFMGFLMGQDPSVSFGTSCSVSPAISLASQFCQSQGWPMPPEGFSKQIKPWK